MLRVLAAAAALLLAACAAPTPTLDSGWPLDSMRRSTVYLANAKGHGSGVLIGPTTVLTAGHVAQAAGGVGGVLSVGFADGEAVSGRIVWVSETDDAALLEVAAPHKYAPADVDCAPARWGEPLALVGNPMGDDWVLVFGAVADLDPAFDGTVMVHMPMAPGASGGPLFAPDGRVRGIAVAYQWFVINQSQSVTGLSFMEPTSDLCEDLPS